MTVFLGCGFAAQYREGGGVFAVPLQWILGLKRLKLDAVWLEFLRSSGDPAVDQKNINTFQRRMREFGLTSNYCLLFQSSASDEHNLDAMRCVGMSRRELLDRLRGSNVLLNLSHSIHPPFLLQFERRIFCDLDPSEIFYWMTKLEMGQSTHHEFCTVGLNANGSDCRLPESSLKWKTFFPLIDTEYYRARAAPKITKFATVGQWYWGGAVEVDGEFPDLSKKHAFDPYLDLPRRLPHVRFELAMNIAADDPERDRLAARGWHLVDPHSAVRTPRMYQRYLTSATSEFTAIKGVDVTWRTGWVSDRAATFLSLGRPVITEETGASKYLPAKSGFLWIEKGNAGHAAAAVEEVLRGWRQLSREARECAVEFFDAAKNLRHILDL